ncbi:MAG TPA: glutamate formimidoyltransferase [Thermoanaerobaculia bacterium]|nr:glutamate formimidoyltransferase [Thermoanaerobaculia bacterium]HXK66899.1 glutamate formimidoyltransferase [Thermoanaerobaculia bacterium]
MKLVECVPNFSEGRNRDVIDAIVGAMAGVKGVRVLDVDPGAATNRTVVTLVGDPDAIVEGAFQGIKKASEVIDMRLHRGEHARQGATDVCPFVPVAGVTMDDCVELAKKLGKRVGEELKIPVYLYEAAAATPERKNLANIRKGEYEALPKKLNDPKWAPDFGPAEFNARAGATVIGARPFLIAYNINLNTKNKLKANGIAFSLREQGRIAKDEDGNTLKDEKGEAIREPGLFKECKAVGWFIDEYRRAQISINLTNYHVTPPHDVFDAACRLAEEKGLRVTGSEVVGMVPLEPILQAGRHYLKRQTSSSGVSEEELIQTAVQSMGLDEVAPFDPKEKIIEYKIGLKEGKLVAMGVREFTNELASDSPAPGGGSVAALVGALSAGLAAMVANLTFNKKGFRAHNDEMNDVAETGQKLKDAFLSDIDRDTDAFNDILDAVRLPSKSPEEIEAREAAIQSATRGAIDVPLGVLKRTKEILPLVEFVALNGNPNAASDAGVAAASARTAAWGAYLNVMINMEGVTDSVYVERTRDEARKVLDSVQKESDRLLNLIHEKILAGKSGQGGNGDDD